MRRKRIPTFVIVVSATIVAIQIGNVLIAYHTLSKLEEIEAPVKAALRVATSGKHSSPVDDMLKKQAELGPKFLWGIPSVASWKERQRRKLIRETYLSYYKDDPNNVHRICSLSELVHQQVQFEDCQIAYVFFMGANEEGPTELMHPNATFPMTVDTSEMFSPESDVVYLNIRENQFDGKMHTWFKYGADVAKEWKFDYIAKVDSDTLLLTPNFLEYAADQLPMAPQNVRVYGGLPLEKTSCDPEEKDDHPCPLPLTGPIYMSGELSFMSPDLADFITSDECDRKSVTISHEDVSLSNYVFLHPDEVTIKPIMRDQVLRKLEWRTRVRTLRSFTSRVGLKADWHIKHLPYKGTLWCHSLSRSGGYFKDFKNIREAWREFLDFKRQPSSQLSPVFLQIAVTSCLLFIVLLKLRKKKSRWDKPGRWK